MRRAGIAWSMFVLATLCGVLAGPAARHWTLPRARAQEVEVTEAAEAADIPTRLAVPDFAANERAGPDLVRAVRTAVVEALRAYAPISRPADIDIAMVAERMPTGADGATALYNRATAACDLAAAVGASHAVVGRVTALTTTVTVELRVAAADGRTFTVRKRRMCKNASEAPRGAAELAAELGLAKPPTRDPAADAWGSRRDGSPLSALRGETAATAQALADGLSWLARHQAADGHWSAAGFVSECDAGGPRCGGTGSREYDVGVTALALLALLADGNSPNDGAHAESVARGLEYLVAQQDAEGCFGRRDNPHFMYGHLAAASAVAEASGMTRDAKLRQAAQKGVVFTLSAHNPYLAWRYGVRDGDNDTSVTAWAVTSLRVAELAAIEVADPAVYRGASAWIDKMTEPEKGRVGYQRRGGSPARPGEQLERYPPELSESLTAAGMLIRLIGDGSSRGGEWIAKGVQLVSQHLPDWNIDRGTIDLYYWYWATLAMYELGGRPWLDWNAKLQGALVDNQVRTERACAFGAWPEAGPWAADGGRVYTTAMACLCLAVYGRYDEPLSRERAGDVRAEDQVK